MGQCAIPDLEEDQAYTQVAAGYTHTVLLRSDNDKGQCAIPDLEEDQVYTQVAAGSAHTVLLRSDGRAVACGGNRLGQCDVPALPPSSGLTHGASSPKPHCVLPVTVLQASFDGSSLRFTSLVGGLRHQFEAVS